MTAALEAHPLITLERGEIAGLPPADWDSVDRRHRPAHLARRSPRRSARSPARTQLAFFDAIAPIVHRESIDMAIAWLQSRYDKAGPGGTGADYINCPMTREQYEAFVDALLAGDKTEFKDWERPRPISTAACRSR